jgi:hypothetical protein
MEIHMDENSRKRLLKKIVLHHQKRRSGFPVDENPWTPEEIEKAKAQRANKKTVIVEALGTESMEQTERLVKLLRKFKRKSLVQAWDLIRELEVMDNNGELYVALSDVQEVLFGILLVEE